MHISAGLFEIRANFLLLRQKHIALNWNYPINHKIQFIALEDLQTEIFPALQWDLILFQIKSAEYFLNFQFK